MTGTTFTRSLSALALLACGAILLAGDLNPPAGPVAPTMKTLDEIEARTPINLTNTPGDADSLYKITAPGSYYLTGNITGVVGKHGIEITSSDVAIDLNGFELAGVAGSLDGVAATAPNLANITVHNGSVIGWGDDGIDLGSAGATNLRVENILASDNASDGVRVGASSRVSGCSGMDNGAFGIVTSFNGVVSDCIAGGNASVGIVTSVSSSITGCTATGNGDQGIGAGTGASVRDCSAYNNSGSGITLSTGATATNCSAYSNAGDGFSLASACAIVGCTASLNDLDGIRASADNIIKDNVCDSNGNGGDGAGIHLSSNDARVEGNNCTDNDRGIDVDFAGNVIVRNTCSGNSVNWDIAAGNVCYVITPALNTAFTGDSGGTSPTTNPWVNFTY